MRIDGRANNELRPVKITPDFIKFAEGSVLVEMGDTKVICTASIEDRVPPFLKDSGQGWVTAEYGMLPRSTATRNVREAAKGQGGRTHEIQRLIGRSLRTVVNMQALGERTVYMDCDVIQADGGTRTAAITGSFIALAKALHKLKQKENIQVPLIRNMVAAISVGFVDGAALLDLNYSEDSSAWTDMNIIMTDAQQIIEIQGTAERNPFSCDQLNELLTLSKAGIAQLIAIQREVLGFPVPF